MTNTYMYSQYYTYPEQSWPTKKGQTRTTNQSNIATRHIQVNIKQMYARLGFPE